MNSSVLHSTDYSFASLLTVLVQLLHFSSLY